MTILKMEDDDQSVTWGKFSDKHRQPIAYIFAIFSHVNPCKCGNKICVSIHRGSQKQGSGIQQKHQDFLKQLGMFEPFGPAHELVIAG